VGQDDPKVKYLARGEGRLLYFSEREVMVRAAKSVTRMELVGASARPTIDLLDQQPHFSNYLQGSDQAKWRTNVAQYRRLRYREVYPGIDLIFYGNQEQLEYDFLVRPGADPNRIELRFAGMKSLDVNADGDLVLRGEGGSIVHKQPIVYQEQDGQRIPVAGRYVVVNRNRVRFEVAEYDRSEMLVIDPILTYSSYLGGTTHNSAEEIAYAVARDPEGNLYVAGRTLSTNCSAARRVSEHC